MHERKQNHGEKQTDVVTPLLKFLSVLEKNYGPEHSENHKKGVRKFLELAANLFSVGYALISFETTEHESGVYLELVVQNPQNQTHPTDPGYTTIRLNTAGQIFYRGDTGSPFAEYYRYSIQDESELCKHSIVDKTTGDSLQVDFSGQLGQIEGFQPTESIYDYDIPNPDLSSTSILFRVFGVNTTTGLSEDRFIQVTVYHENNQVETMLLEGVGSHHDVMLVDGGTIASTPTEQLVFYPDGSNLKVSVDENETIDWLSVDFKSGNVVYLVKNKSTNTLSIEVLDKNGRVLHHQEGPNLLSLRAVPGEKHFVQRHTEYKADGSVDEYLTITNYQTGQTREIRIDGDSIKAIIDVRMVSIDGVDYVKVLGILENQLAPHENTTSPVMIVNAETGDIVFSSEEIASARTDNEIIGDFIGGFTGFEVKEYHRTQPTVSDEFFIPSVMVLLILFQIALRVKRLSPVVLEAISNLILSQPNETKTS